jgi:hypothetical protein
MGLAHEGYITSYMDYTQDDVASGIQDFLICIEMAAISYAHQFVFSYRDMEVIVSECHTKAGSTRSARPPQTSDQTRRTA